MRLILIIVTMTLLVSINCNEDAAPTTESTPIKLEKGTDNDTSVETNAEMELNKLKQVDTDEVGDLPILPPLILLDFAGDSDNSSSTDGKSKRTVNNGLGYGYLRNNLFSGKTNLYFPGSKSGTTVSIEESISPFAPKTIIESYKPITERPDETPIKTTPNYKQNLRTTNAASQSHVNNNNNNNNNNNFATSNQAVFGQRTKLLKASPTDYSFQSYSTTPKSNIASYTTTRPNYRGVNKNVNTYTTAQPNYQDVYSNNRQTFTTIRPNYDTYSTTPTPTQASTHDTRYTVANFNQQRQNYDVSSSTPRTLPFDPSVFNLPRFVVENGIKYENKIVWKYPDGRIVTPTTSPFVDYANQPKINSYNNYQTVTYQNPISQQQQQQTQDNRYTQDVYNNQNIVYQNQYQDSPSPARYPQEPTVNNIYSQRPAQFPTDAEPAQPSRPSEFVSVAGKSSAVSSASSSSQSQAQNYDFSYQTKYGLRPREKDNNEATRYDQRLKYANNQNTEYVYSTETPPQPTTPSSTNLFTTQGQLSPTILSKYTPQAQKYLTKVFENNQEATTEQYNPHLAQAEQYNTQPVQLEQYNLQPGQFEQYNSQPGQFEQYNSQPAPLKQYTNSQYANTNYENLLNYNPSISQYIRDPSSILNAQPTFIQTGKSLIPVIILRVDGVSPVQQKVTPNINLKALLQQYLSDYATSKAALSQNSNYQYANQITEKTINQSPINELTQLTQVLSRLSPTYDQDSIASKKLAQHPLDYTPRPSYPDFYDEEDKNIKKTTFDDSRNKFGTRTVNKLQKVKSVQIIEDPRFPNLKKTK
ncbi:probable basic-leucine zipper transcription factor N [Aphidius gifuensis]|uniref:probable basic-leucine zipper transcription factor N n=1 Tax=Aphidius gifuensis TaxID=684658 RepID=UPI001CDD3D60|nr:probable basic-leucine zipper transcription factor N [Aphidius gifuensis]